MSDSLRDQLLGLGFKPAPKLDKPVARAGKPAANPSHRKPRPANAPDAMRRDSTPSRAQQQKKPRHQDDIDLAKAYAIRAQKEKDERIEAERIKQEEARLRREARQKLAEYLEGKSLNAADADIARHFEYGGKIKRIHVTAEQLRALNAGALGVVQLNGRYLLVDVETLLQAEAIFAQAVALKVDPDAARGDDPYADPQYQVPDDLVW